MRTGNKSLDAKMPQTWSEDAGLTWSSITHTSLPNNDSALDAVSLKDGRHLLVYNHSTRTAPDTGSKGRGILTVAVTRDGINWEAALVLDYRIEGSGLQYSYPAVIQTKDGLVHVASTWHRKRTKHVVIDPNRLETYPIVNGQWPKDKIPWIVSEE
jgi:predicted neuraminidase